MASRAKKIDTQSTPGRPGEADKDFMAVLAELKRAGSGSGSYMRPKRVTSVNNLSARGGPTSN